jgi:tetratricopeptide (TPR) repeat protein
MIDHRPTNDWQATTDEIEAVRRIDAAINEIKRASIDDGKDMYYHPQMDEHPDHAGRLHDALDLLRKAQQDVNQGEDYGPAQGLQQRAMIHINEAIRLTERTMAALMPQPDHPRYLQALSDLRVARWMIDHRSGDWQATEDEFAAVREIDAAINEIKRAAIDDRKDVNDHVGVDEHPGHMDRLRDAEFYLNKAQQDVNQDEDNRFADGLQARALQHINEAIRNTHRAIRQ